MPAEARGEDHVCVLRVPRGRGDQRPGPGCLRRGRVGLKCGRSKSGAEVKGKKMFCSFSENKLNILSLVG